MRLAWLYLTVSLCSCVLGVVMVMVLIHLVVIPSSIRPMMQETACTIAEIHLPTQQVINMFYDIKAIIIKLFPAILVIRSHGRQRALTTGGES